MTSVSSDAGFGPETSLGGSTMAYTGAVEASKGPKPLTVLQVVPRLDVGGVERTTLEIAEAICTAGGRALVATAGGQLEFRIQRAGGEIVHMNADSKNPLTMWQNARLMRKLIRDITGQTGIKQRSQQIMFAFKMAGEVEGEPTSQDLAQAFAGSVIARALIANAAIFAVMWALGAWWWWFAFWALPLLTWFQLVLRVRNIAEHGAVEFSDDPLRNVRTTRAGPLMRLILAPYWVNYHLEHHLVMHVPCRNLPKMHRLMLSKGHGAEMEIGRSYWDVIRLASSRPAAA